MKFGITLANRGVLLGLTTVPKLLALADAVESCPLLDSVWVGNALFVNQRLDALTLLAAIAGRTSRFKLGPSCMATFALRDPRVFAYEGHHSTSSPAGARSCPSARAAGRRRPGTPRPRQWAFRRSNVVSG